MWTRSPGWTVEPVAGCWYTTVVPVCPVTITASTRRPRSVRRVTAASRSMPTTFGIGNSRGPSETTIVIVEPGCSGVCAATLCEITKPRWTESEYFRFTVMVNADSRFRASASVLPITLGTGTGCGPLLTTTSIAEPCGRIFPLVTAWETTRPAGMCSSYRLGWAPSSRPASVSASLARATVRPTSRGTSTGGGPSDGTSVTMDPLRSSVPADGRTRRTDPFGTLGEYEPPDRRTVRPARCNSARAAGTGSPSTWGTRTEWGTT